MTSAPLAHLALGVGATILAATRVVSWVAIGDLCGVRRLRLSPAANAATSLLAGAATIACAYALLAAAGAIRAAVALDVALSVGALLARGRGALALLGLTARALWPSGTAGRAAVTALLLLLWIVAIGPPRDADVLHYHLAHVRQILADGVWRQIPICAYGPPFGWSLGFLPFVWLKLPEVAQVVNGAVWLVAGAVVGEAARGGDDPLEGERRARLAVSLWLGASLLPQAMKAATTAMSDSMMVLAVAASIALLVQSGTLSRAGYAALGFVAVIPFNSRYQAGALALTTFMLVVGVASRDRTTAPVVAYMLGAVPAALLAAPFYIANVRAFGTPFWPIAGVSPTEGAAAVAALARECGNRELGTSSGPLAAVVRLFRSPTVFPIPLVAVVASSVALLQRRQRILALFAPLWFAVWWIAQPLLNPRYAIYLVPAAVAVAAGSISSAPRARWAVAKRAVAWVCVAALSVVALAYSSDYLRLAVDGDVERFHRATWYWPAIDWVNRNTPEDARVLAILHGGQTYHLERWNRSADVGTSAVVDWGALHGGCALAAELRSNRVTHVVYGPGMWQYRQEGGVIANAVAEAQEAGVLVEEGTFDTPLTISRLLRKSVRARAVVYAVDSTRARQFACGGPTR